MTRAVSIATTLGLLLGAAAYCCGLPWWLALGIAVASAFVFGGLARSAS